MSFEDHAQEFAKACKKCDGKRYALQKGSHVICSCQLKALIKHRCDQIPTDLKQKEWHEYTGNALKGTKEIEVINWRESRDMAFAYCFSKESVNNLSVFEKKSLSQDVYDKAVTKRISQSKIIERLKEGANLAIFGDDATGKTLLAALVAKEIIFASVLLGDFEFKWVSFNTLINSLSFNRIDYELLDDVFCVDFLILDNVYIPSQGNYMKNVLDEIFYDRLVKKKPTILTGALGTERDTHFVKTRDFSTGEGRITAKQALGDEFYRLINSINTHKIVLKTGK